MAKKSDLEYEKSISTLENRVSIKKLAADQSKRYGYYFEDLPKELRRYAFYVSGLEKLRTVESIRTSLVRATEKGQSFKQWQDSLDVESLRSMTKARQELVFRTNLNNAYSQGTRHAAFENKDVTPYLMYDAVNDSRVRPSHEAVDGVIRSVDDDFWDTFTPPVGFNCRCALIPLSKEQANRERKAKGKTGYITSEQEIGKQAREVTKDKTITAKNISKKIPDKGFETKSKLGQFSKGAKKTSEQALEKLPRNSPYKNKFKEQIEQVDRKVDLWWETVKNKFKS